MYDYMIEEMADAIAIELHIDNNDVLRVLHRYWQDKIAHVWQADHIVQCAFNMGKPILMEHAVGLLDEVFQFHDSDEGIRWNMMEDVLRDYRLDFNRLPVEQHDEVRGVFKVWRQGPAHDAPAPSSAADIAAAYSASSASLVQEIKDKWTDETLTETDDMYGEIWPRGITLAVLINHQAHHRGQVTVLMRQAGLSVPGVYGPSKEEWVAYGMEPLN